MTDMITRIRYTVDIISFCKEVLGFNPDKWQERVMISPSKRILLNCSRQSGKSTVSAAISLHTAIFRPNSLILLISPSLRQSSELFKKVQSFYKLIPDQEPLPEDNRLSMAMQNGSRIVSLPSSEANIRGFSAPALIIEDEASRVDDALYRAIRPMLAAGNGKIFLMSTPWGKRGHYWEEWASKNPWERIKITADNCPRISPEFLEEERKSLGEWWYLQEYMCEFCDTSDSLFTYDCVMSAMDDNIAPLFSVTGQAPGKLPGLINAQPLFTGGP